MAKASQISLEGNNSFLFKGPFGFGKTLAAASFAMDGPLYLSYWDKKTPIELKTFFTKERFGPIAEQIMDNIEYDCYASQNANEYLNKLISLATSGCKYTTVVNDSLTYMTAACVNWSLNFGKGDKERKKIKDILPEWDEYKVETSLISQCMEISKKLPCHVIWTAHPLPTTKVESSGASIKVSKVNSLVSYGTKVAGMVPGGFAEIYHFSQRSEWDGNTGTSSKKYIAELEAVGDEFAKSPLLGYHIKEIDFTNRLFFEVWREKIREFQNKDTPTSTPTPTTTESTVTNPWG